MKNVATIIASENFDLNEFEQNSIIDALQHNGAYVNDIKILSSTKSLTKAVDIFFDGINQNEARELLGHLLFNLTGQVDFIVQSSYNRRKKLIISDMDSTIINEECIDEIAASLGIKDKVATITEQAMNGEIDFADALKLRVSLLKGIEEEKLASIFQSQITFTAGAKTLIQTMKQNGAKAILVSGGFTFFTSRVAKHCGFDAEEANILDFANGVLTGKVKEPILDSNSKLQSLIHFMNESGLQSHDVLAVGDGANDLKMINYCDENNGLGIAFCAKENVNKNSLHHIKIRDLTHILYAQGYSDSDFHY